MVTTSTLLALTFTTDDPFITNTAESELSEKTNSDVKWGEQEKDKKNNPAGLGKGPEPQTHKERVLKENLR